MREYLEILRHTANRYPKNIALLHGDHSLSYEDLSSAIAARADFFGSGGINVEDDVIFKGELSIESVVDLLALFEVGCTVVLKADWLSSYQSNRMIESVRPSVSIVGDRLNRHRNAVRSSLGRDTEILFATSGTSGVPKVVVHSHRSLLHGLKMTLSLQAEGVSVDHSVSTDPIELMVDSVGEARIGLRFLVASPFASMATFTVIQRALLVGECLVLTNEGTTTELLERCASEHITNLMLTPFLAHQVLREQRRVPRRFSSLLAIGIGGGLVPATTVEDIEALFETVVMIGYGSTETGGPVLMSRPSDSLHLRSHTVGRPLAGVEIKLDKVDEAGRGELLIKSPSLMTGYLGGAATGKYESVPISDDGWYHSGDLASMTKDGFTVIHGRTDGMIIRGGQNIDPSLIEEVLEAHPAVLRAGVKGTLSRVPGQQDIVAFVVLTEPRPSQSELGRWCGDRLDPLLVPRRFHQREVLPLAPDGTVVRSAI